MEQLIEAFDASRVNDDDFSLTNNCVNLVMDMLCNLEADLSMDEYMAWASVKVSESPHLQELFEKDIAALGIDVSTMVHGEPLPSVVSESLVEKYVSSFNCATKTDKKAALLRGKV